MNTATMLAAAFAAALALPGAAGAATFTGGWTVARDGVAPGLAVRVARKAAFGVMPDLEVGDSYTFDLFRIWSDETAGRAHAPKISVTFDLANPVAGGVISGVTRDGRSGWRGVVRNGRLTWDGPLAVYFGAGDTGRMTLSLADALLDNGRSGDRGGRGRGATVAATLRYDVAPVPLPAALPLLGLGLGALGVAGRRRRAARSGAAG